MVHAILSAWNVLVLCLPGEIIIIFQNLNPAAPWFLQTYMLTPSLVSSCMHSFKHHVFRAYHVLYVITMKTCWIRRL